MSGQHVVSKWAETVTADNGTAAATRDSETNKAHYVTGISMCFDEARSPALLLTLLDGATVIGNYHVFGVRDVVFDKPLRITSGNLVTASLPASGNAGVFGAVTLTGYTVE